MTQLLLSTAYLPNLQYIRAIAQGEKVFCEQFESFPKQTFRNRCQIFAATGVINLTVPVVKVNSKHLTRDVKISYAENWQSCHWHSIISAYNSSPFFEYFRDYFEIYYTKRYNFLLDYNLEILSKILKILEIKRDINLTSDYIFENDNSFLDLRNVIHPKKNQTENINYYKSDIYPQVFDAKYPFVPNLSIIDILFNIGFEAKDYVFKK